MTLYAAARIARTISRSRALSRELKTARVRNTPRIDKRNYKARWDFSDDHRRPIFAHPALLIVRRAHVSSDNRDERPRSLARFSRRISTVVPHIGVYETRYTVIITVSPVICHFSLQSRALPRLNSRDEARASATHIACKR
jgi:hypothetical protein